MVNKRDYFCFDFSQHAKVISLLIVAVLCLITACILSKKSFRKHYNRLCTRLKRRKNKNKWRPDLKLLLRNKYERKAYLNQVYAVLRFLVGEHCSGRQQDTKSISSTELQQLPNAKRLIERAVHESGHVIAMWFSNTALEMDFVTIIPTADDLGHVEMTRCPTIKPHTAEQYFEFMSIYLAGYLAEALFVPSKTNLINQPSQYKRYQSDFNRFALIARVLAYSHCRCCRNRAGKTELEFTWFYFRQCIIATIALLRIHEQDLVKLVKGLLEKGTLNYEEIQNILGDRSKQNLSFYDEFALNPEQTGEFNTSMKDLMKVAYHAVEQTPTSYWHECWLKWKKLSLQAEEERKQRKEAKEEKQIEKKTEYFLIV